MRGCLLLLHNPPQSYLFRERQPVLLTAHEVRQVLVGQVKVVEGASCYQVRLVLAQRLRGFEWL
jgi:hypothetical protein